MSVDAKLQAASQLIEKHNQKVKEPDAAWDGPLSGDAFAAALRRLGDLTEDRLQGLSHEIIMKCLGVTRESAPLFLVQDIAKVFREGGEKNDPVNPISGHVSVKKAERMTLGELAHRYDPDEPENAVGQRLKALSRGEKFVVFLPDDRIDVPTTERLLHDVKKGHVGLDTCTVKGDIREVFRVGEKPSELVDENPLYPGRPLRSDGTCDQTCRSWAGVDTKVRQMVNILARGAGYMGTLEAAHNLFDFAMAPDAMQKLRQRYPRTAVEFDRQERSGSLPKLKIPLRRPEAAKPIGKGEKVSW